MKRGRRAQLAYVGIGAFLQVAGIFGLLLTGILIGIDSPAAFLFLGLSAALIVFSYIMGFFPIRVN
ncbi:MAG: hypothetical protein ACE5I4_05065 [Thermoplasmata archaeon]